MRKKGLALGFATLVGGAVLRYLGYMQGARYMDITINGSPSTRLFGPELAVTSLELGLALMILGVAVLLATAVLGLMREQ